MTPPASAALRARYATESVDTASPAQLLTMLYDRLAHDLALGAAAIETGDRFQANDALMHAQAIVFELQAALRPSLWEGGGPALSRLYAFVLTELITANLQQDADKVAGCRRIVETLRDAWHDAAAIVAKGDGR